MLAIVFSDIHINNYKAFNEGGRRLNNCIEALERILNYAVKREIKVVLFCGDLYDSQKKLDTDVVNRTIECFKKYEEEDFTIYAISGNHDHASKNLLNKPAVTGLTHLSHVVKNFKLIDNKHVLLDTDNGDVISIAGIPYYEYAEHFKIALDCVIDEFSPNILLTHQTPTGLGNDMIPTDTDINDPLYENFNMVFNGHIHSHAMLSENYMVVGSPLHRDAADEGFEKGFLLIDLEDTSKYKQVKLSTLPKFRRKFKGDEIELGEEKDYILWTPQPVVNATKTKQPISKFEATLKHSDLLTNYWTEVDGKDKELLSVGLELI